LNNQWFSKIAVWLVIAMVLFTVFKQFDGGRMARPITWLLGLPGEVRNNRIKSATIQEGQGGTDIVAILNDDRRVRTQATYLDRGLVGDLINNNVKFDVKPREEGSLLMTLLVSWGPMLLLIGVWVYFMRQMQGGGKGGAFSFGKSKARMLDENNNTVTFADVAGCDEAKEEVKEGRLPEGPAEVPEARRPHSARPAAGRPSGHRQDAAGQVHRGRGQGAVLLISGSDFVEMFVGVGAARARHVRERQEERALHHLHRRNRRRRPPARRRPGRRQRRARADAQPDAGRDGRLRDQPGRDRGGRHQPPRHPGPALLRPGRFDRQVYVTLPDIRGREQILNVHMRKIPIGQDVNPIIARGTPGMSGADLANLCNEAALMAARRNARVVEMQDFEKAKDKIIMGPERKSMVMPEEERRNTAYHEAATR
jgi:cell division protease FtsH